MNSAAKTLLTIAVALAAVGLLPDPVGLAASEFPDSIHGILEESAAAKSELEKAAETAYLKGRFHESTLLYGRAIQNNPACRSLYLGRGMAYEMIDRPDKAMEDYKKALELDPNDYRALESLAGMYERGGLEIEQAIQLYKQALELDPRPAWQENLAVWIKVLETRLQPENASAVASWHLGIEREQEGRTEEAESLYSRAIQLDPKLFQAYYSRALLRLKASNASGAIADLNATIDLYPSFRGALVQRGTIHEQLGNNKQALEDFQLAAQLDPRDPLVHFQLGRMLEQEGEFPKALESYQETLRWKPKPELQRLTLERLTAVNGRLQPTQEQRARIRRMLQEFW